MIALRSETEIELMRQANQVVAEAHALLAEMVQPGIKTKDLDAAAEALILARGGRPAFKGYLGYPAATCISIEDVVVHGIPGDRRLREGEIVSIDIGVCLDEYYGDAAWTLPVGEIDPRRQLLLEVTDLALSRAIKRARAGNYMRDISRAVEETCSRYGFGVVRQFVGHGIGREMHEAPQVPNFDTGKRGTKLKSGMVLAIEPMINLGGSDVKVLEDGWTAVTVDGSPSAHFEHSVVVREHGGEILSGSEICVWGQRDERVSV